MSVDPDDYTYSIETDYKSLGTHKTLQWTTEPPKVEGWYWFRGHHWLLDNLNTELSYVSVMNGVISFSPLINGPEWDHEYDIRNVTHWLGPLPIPEPPEVPNG